MDDVQYLTPCGASPILNHQPLQNIKMHFVNRRFIEGTGNRSATAMNSVKLFFKKFWFAVCIFKFYKAQLKHNILFEKFKGYVTFLLYVLFVCQSAVSIIKSVTWVDDCCKHFCFLCCPKRVINGIRNPRVS